MSKAFQPAEPTPVHTVNFTGFMRSIPAGMEIKERIPGRKRRKKTEAGPNLSNQCKELSTKLDYIIYITTAHLHRRKDPIHPPIKYTHMLPITYPTVALHIYAT